MSVDERVADGFCGGCRRSRVRLGQEKGGERA